VTAIMKSGSGNSSTRSINVFLDAEEERLR
jgi:hypothetical protein